MFKRKRGQRSGKTQELPNTSTMGQSRCDGSTAAHVEAFIIHTTVLYMHVVCDAKHDSQGIQQAS